MNLNFNMSEELPFGGHSKAFRPIIPKPHISTTPQTVSELIVAAGLPANSTLRDLSQHFYQDYLRLFKENTILNRQLQLITEETDKLRRKHEDLNVKKDNKIE